MKLNIKYKLIAPLSHIGETASTGSYFQTILTSSGKLPVITANSIRGQLRNCAAKHLLDTWGIKVDKEIFHVLFSGGNINTGMRDDIEKALVVRKIFPMISVFGAGLGDMILAGKMNMTFAYPVCRESEEITGIESDLSWHKLIEEIEFTRTDDSKNDKISSYIEELKAEKEAKASTQMRYSVQYMAAGTELVQAIVLTNVNNIEKGALLTAFREWFKNPTMGGMSAKGFGFFTADINDISGGKMTVGVDGVEISTEFKELTEEYDIYINSVNYAPHLDSLKGNVKKEKRDDKEIAKTRKKYPQIEWIEDCLMLQEFFNENGLKISIPETESFWKKYSNERYATGWMSGANLNDESRPEWKNEVLSALKEYAGME